MTADDLTTHADAVWKERDRRVAALHDRQLEALRTALPLDDPDRHAMDTVADDLFAHLAPGYPNTCSPADFAASVAARFVEPVVWDDCEPAFAPKPAKRPVADVETGGAL
jgi:hypothetical protein